MKPLDRKSIGLKEDLPIKVVQFGEGNFLRAFIDYAFQQLNNTVGFNAGVVVVQPIETGLINVLNDQDGLYTLFLKGVKNGVEIQEKELMTNIVKGIDPHKDFDSYINLAKEEALEFVISNTTEAGIAYIAKDKPNMRPPSSFPAKLTLLLFERFKFFNGNEDKGLTIIPCELINYNAGTLKEIILKYIDDWSLGKEFESWIHEHNSFHNTLVDRIVPGYPKDQIEAYNAQLDYQDNLIVTAEKFFLWVIEGDQELKEKLAFDKTDLDVKIVENLQPFRTRKVRILNGAHTAMVPFSLLFGNKTVKETIDNDFTGKFIRDLVFDEIIETLDMESLALNTFANEVFDRFRNPFIKHELSSIALNSISKFKVRVLPSLIEFERMNKKLPVHLTFAFACLIRFYNGQWKGKTLPINDDENNVVFFQELWKTNDLNKVVNGALKNSGFWDQYLKTIKSLGSSIEFALEEIERNGIETGYQNFCKLM